MPEHIQYRHRPATNFQLAFTPGYRFQRDEWEYEIEVVSLGELCLPTGKIVAADPSDLESRIEDYFQREVAPGSYPVDLAIRHKSPLGGPRSSSHTACLRIRFGDEPIADWIIATTRDQQPENLLPFQIYGYGVDAGMGSFADTYGLVTLRQQYEEQGKDLFEDFYIEQVVAAYETSKWQCANILLDRITGANLIFCSSGEGDGFYASYWGLSVEGHPISLVTDFGLLSHHVYAKREIGVLSELVGQEMVFNLPGGEVHLQLEMPDNYTLVVKTTGAGADTVEIEIQPSFPSRRESYSAGMGKRTISKQFARSLPAQTVVVASYLNHIEAL